MVTRRTLSDFPWDLFDLVESVCGLGIWLYDIESQQVRWSRGLYNILGLSPGMHPPSLASIDGLQRPGDPSYSSVVACVIAARRSQAHEFSVIQPNGVERWLASHCQLLTGRLGHAEAVCGIVQDITESREAARMLKTNADRREVLFSKVVHVTWKTEAAMMGAGSVQWQRLTGQDPTTAYAGGWLDAVHAGDREQFRADWSRAQETNTPWSSRLRLRVASGDYRWFVAYGCPVIGQSGDLVEWVGVWIDLDDDKGAERLADPTEPHVTGAHLRAARALVEWSVRDLAERAGVTSAVIRRLEERHFPSITQDPRWDVVRLALANAGAEFVAVPGGIGVWPRPAS
jgi:PAS domain S-box-containing protein